MTFIMNMASGTLQDDDNLLCSSKKPVRLNSSESADRYEYVELQLATIQPEVSLHPSQALVAGLDIEKLIQTIED